MATVFKVVPNRGRYRCIIVNIFVLGRTKGTKQFYRQAIDLKKIIKAFQPVESIIDTNGLIARSFKISLIAGKSF